ncbi:MAG: SPOR domain-containing protein [Myxococcaceae bacterium]
MRDSHRLKEKYELSLDSRQIVTLTVASLVVLGGVFVLGVVVGKKLSAESQKLDQPADILSAADQKTEALAQADKAQPLTFQEELTKRAPEPVPAPEPVKNVIVLKPAELTPKPPEPAKVEEPVEPKLAEAKVAEVKPVLPETPKSEPVATRTNDAGALKEAFGKVQKAPEAPTPSAEGSWTLQLSAYQDKAEAERFAAGLRDKGYAPFIIEANVAGKGTWFRVRMGRFGSKDAASTYLADFKRETSIAGIVTNN